METVLLACSERACPATYPAGGWVLDLSDRIADLHSVTLTWSDLASITAGIFSVKRNDPAPGKARIRVWRVAGVTKIELTAGSSLAGARYFYQVIGFPQPDLSERESWAFVRHRAMSQESE